MALTTSLLRQFAIGFPVILLLLMPLIAPALWHVWGGDATRASAIGALVLFGIVTPVAIIIVRHHIRRTRIRQIDLFARSFGTRSGNTPHFPSLSFEFVRGKYFTGLDEVVSEGTTPSARDVPLLPFFLPDDRMLLIASVPFILIAMLGASLVFAPILPGPDGQGLMWQMTWLPPNLMTSGPSSTLATLFLDHARTLEMAAMAFVGAYLFSLRTLLRAVVVFDLTPATFLRVFAHMLTTAAVAIILFRALDAAGLLTAFTSEAQADAAGGALPAGKTVSESVALLMAFLIGFVPEAGLSYALSLTRLAFKSRYSQIERHTKQIPLTVLDGIDPFIAFRLEEANIHDVQNLATYNPIMLDIESPFGIYTTMDWVAQAQLCTLVGAERFLLLKSVNIRTILDLRRAILSQDADAALQDVVGQILTCDTKRERAMRDDVGITDYPNIHGALGRAAIMQLTEVMVDDLHFHRLLRIWDLIQERIETDRAASSLAPAAPSHRLPLPQNVA